MNGESNALSVYYIVCYLMGEGETVKKALELALRMRGGFCVLCFVFGYVVEIELVNLVFIFGNKILLFTLKCFVNPGPLKIVLSLQRYESE